MQFASSFYWLTGIFALIKKCSYDECLKIGLTANKVIKKENQNKHQEGNILEC